MLEWGYVAVEIEPVQGLELESDVAFEKIADVRWSIHATRMGLRWQWAILSMRQGAYSSSASKRPLRSQRRIIPEPPLVGLRRSFVVQIPAVPRAPRAIPLTVRVDAYRFSSDSKEPKWGVYPIIFQVVAPLPAGSL
jgi:hypothetical protein